MKQAQYRLLDRYKFCKDFTNFNKNQLIALVLIFIGCYWYFSSSYTFNVQKSRKINEELKRFKVFSVRTYLDRGHKWTPLPSQLLEALFSEIF